MWVYNKNFFKRFWFHLSNRLTVWFLILPSLLCKILRADIINPKIARGMVGSQKRILFSFYEQILYNRFCQKKSNLTWQHSTLNPGAEFSQLTTCLPRSTSKVGAEQLLENLASTNHLWVQITWKYIHRKSLKYHLSKILTSVTLRKWS